MKLPDAWLRSAAVFDDVNLVSFAPVLALAERAGLSGLIAEKVRIDPAATKVQSAGVNPGGTLTSIIAGMACGADCIEDLDVIRSGGMKRLFDGVYAATTLGQFLREFTHGHTLQLGPVLRRHLVHAENVSEALEAGGRAEIAEQWLTAALETVLERRETLAARQDDPAYRVAAMLAYGLTQQRHRIRDLDLPHREHDDLADRLRTRSTVCRSTRMTGIWRCCSGRGPSSPGW